MRPWTRMQCARLLEEAQEELADGDTGDNGASRIYDALAAEFADELARLDGAPNIGGRVESIYTRSTEVSGTPLRHGFHYGQTNNNDYGRPYWTGFNNVTGVTGWS